MKDLLPGAMKSKAEALRAYSEATRPDEYPECVDFGGIIRQVISQRKLRAMSRAINFSHSYLYQIGANNSEPRWSVGVRILKWVKENMK